MKTIFDCPGPSIWRLLMASLLIVIIIIINIVVVVVVVVVVVAVVAYASEAFLETPQKSDWGSYCSCNS